MEEQKKGTFRKFIEENSKTICGAGLVLAGCFIGAAVGRRYLAQQINSGLYAMFAKNPELEKIFMETKAEMLKKN